MINTFKKHSYYVIFVILAVIEFNPKEAGDLESLAKEEPQDYYDVTKE